MYSTTKRTVAYQDDLLTGFIKAWFLDLDEIGGQLYFLKADY